MRPFSIAQHGVLSLKKILGPALDTVALLHCNEQTFREPVGVLTNSVPGGVGFTSYNQDSFYWYAGDPIFGQCIFTGDEACVLHSNSKVVFSGAFCLEGFFMPVGTNGPLLEIADGSAWDETGDNFISFYNATVDEDENNWVVQTEIFAKPVGGTFSVIAHSNSWLLPKEETDGAHVALYRDTDGFVAVTYKGNIVAVTDSGYPGTFNGHINFASGYDQTNGTIYKGGHQMRIAEFRVTRGIDTYTAPFSPPNARFPNP